MQQSPPPEAPRQADIELQVREDKLVLLFRQSFPAIFISLATAGLLAWFLWRHVDQTLIIAWLAILAVSSLGRLAVFATYFRGRPRGLDLLRLERRYTMTLLVSSLVWGIGAMLLMPVGEFVYQVVTLLILTGMAGGAVSMYSPRFKLAVGAMVAVLLPSTVWMFAQGGEEQVALAIGVSMFMLAMLRAAKVLADALQRNLHLSHELHSAHAAADLQAKTDALTGINNRRAFLDQGEQIVRYCERHELALSVLVMDLDHFKAINDSRGHNVGDMVLRQVGEIMRKLFRRSDVYGRTGGEEFAVVLPHTSVEQAMALAEKLRRALAETGFECGGTPLEVTASVGVAGGGYDLATLLVHADKAMYRAKEQGRNQVVRHEASPPGIGD
jgi:diguanylate cyclase (GGDEF)-like protein